MGGYVTPFSSPLLGIFRPGGKREPLPCVVMIKVEYMLIIWLVLTIENSARGSFPLFAYLNE